MVSTHTCYYIDSKNYLKLVYNFFYILKVHASTRMSFCYCVSECANRKVLYWCDVLQCEVCLRFFALTNVTLTARITNSPTTHTFSNILLRFNITGRYYLYTTTTKVKSCRAEVSTISIFWKKEGLAKVCEGSYFALHCWGRREGEWVEKRITQEWESEKGRWKTSCCFCVAH